MKISPSAAPVWINANHSFKHFDRRIVRYLSKQLPIAYWEYIQNLDEASSMDIALSLLHDYLKSRSAPVDMIGHGTGGLLGLLYARKYPHRVKSLVLLGVGCYPAFDWQAHYYHLRKLLPCSQEIILGRMVQMMFGYQSSANTTNLVEVLKKDLSTAPTRHSLYQRDLIKSGGVSMPMMVCGSQNDRIVDFLALQKWKNHLKKEDLLWTIPLGHHFFHYFFAEQTGRQIIKFWKGVESKSNTNVLFDVASKLVNT